MTYDLAVFIGRFQPLTLGHTKVIQTALDNAQKVVILVGSANTPRSYRNPWSFDERKRMILDAFPNDNHRFYIEAVEDTVYNNEQWVKNIQEAVTSAFIKAKGQWYPTAKIALVGHSKDNSSFYLKLFPQWESINVPNYNQINATDVRDKLFNKMNFFANAIDLFKDELPPATIDYLTEFSNTPEFAKMINEYEYVAKYKESWANAPFPPTFVTVDAVVVQSGHILLVQRGHSPGKGLWALPGGFINQYEKIEDAVIRELREETRIKVPAPHLRGSVKHSAVFDDPYRSSRGRTITHAFLIHLDPQEQLPKVKGSDDAAFAKWIPLSEVTRNMMFEDHYDIIVNLTALL